MNNIQNNLLGQMQALESLAQGQTLQTVQESEKKTSFGELMQQAIEQVNGAQSQASELSRAFEKGDSQVDLSEVMIAMQKSRISFQALSEVRNKLLTAYQDVMNMPV